MAGESAQIPWKFILFIGMKREANENGKTDVKAVCFELVISKWHVVQIRQAGIFFIQLLFIGNACFFHLFQLFEEWFRDSSTENDAIWYIWCVLSEFGLDDFE